MMPSYRRGFTIVELLIVIVVIAILAAITVVAYNGIQSRNYDAAVQTDLSNFAKAIQLAAADTGEFPVGGAIRTAGVDSPANGHTFPGITFKPNRSVYDSSNNNFYYCTGTQTSDSQKTFRILAKSKSGNVFSMSNNGGLQNLGTSVSLASGYCLTPYSNTGSWSYGFATPSTWNSAWIN